MLLEARLDNLVLMINNVLDSLDLNPILVTLGQSIGEIVDGVGGILTDEDTDTASEAGEVERKRSFRLARNILYSINDYSGRTHTNRVLAQNGSIIDQLLDNEGTIHGQKTVGYYETDMRFNGYNHTVTDNGDADRELEYVYEPYIGLSTVCAIFMNSVGAVVGTQVLSESGGGGSSSIGDD